MTVTMKNLEHLERMINKALGHGHTQMYADTPRGEPSKANGGFVYLTGQTGQGYRFEQMAEGGGARDVCTFGTKSETYEKGQVFIDGISAGKALR